MGERESVLRAKYDCTCIQPCEGYGDEKRTDITIASCTYDYIAIKGFCSQICHMVKIVNSKNTFPTGFQSLLTSKNKFSPNKYKPCIAVNLNEQTPH